MIDLTTFLLARIAEDEADARDAYYEGQRWVPEEEAVVAADRDLDPIMFLDRKRDAYHAANWSPARVLAECEAKRRIVEALTDAEDAVAGYNNDDPNNPPSYWQEWGNRHALRLAAECLALPYAGHPDFREEWKP